MTDQSRRLPQPGAVAVTIRVAHREDGPVLHDVERRAGEQFRSIGMDAVADDESASLATLAAYAKAGRSWVAVDDGGSMVGYVLADVVDGCAHLEQISVLPDHQGRGMGQLLLAQVKEWARADPAPPAGLPMPTPTGTPMQETALNRDGWRHAVGEKWRQLGGAGLLR